MVIAIGALDPMVITIGANGDGALHWRHYVHHHWSHWIAIGTIFMAPLAPMAPMARTPNRYDTFTDYYNAKIGIECQPTLTGLAGLQVSPHEDYDKYNCCSRPYKQATKY
jgi:hypothetical protein